MKVRNCVQGTTEWFRARGGVFTASYAEVVIPLPSKLKKGIVEYSTKRAAYMYRLAVESILHVPADDIDPGTPKIGGFFWPDRGIKMESEAVEALKDYAAKRQIKLGEVEPIGFCVTDDGKIGCSPDRWIEKTKTLIEVKCPAAWTQAEYLLANDDFWRGEHYPQVQCQLLVTGYSRAILWTYHPRMPPIFRVTPRDQDYIDMLQKEIVKFNDELAILTSKLRAISGWKPFTYYPDFGRE